MIVIAENPLVTSPSPTKVTRSPDKPRQPRPRGRPLSSKSARIQEMVLELEQADRLDNNMLDTGQVQHCVVCSTEMDNLDSSCDIVTLLNGNLLQSVTKSLEEIIPGE